MIAFIASASLFIARQRMLARAAAVSIGGTKSTSSTEGGSVREKSSSQILSPPAPDKGADPEKGCEDCSLKKSLADTVKAYDRHVIICGYEAGFPASHIEKGNDFIAKLQAQLKPSKMAFKITGCMHKNSHADRTDVIVYPEKLMVTINTAMDAEITALASWLVDPNKTRLSLPSSPLPWDYLILVCVHGARDARCGSTGTELMHALESQVKRQESISSSPPRSVYICGSSHVGGHEFAGNAIIYPAGHWYGYLDKSHAEELLNAVLSGHKMEACFRGRASKYSW